MNIFNIVSVLGPVVAVASLLWAVISYTSSLRREALENAMQIVSYFGDSNGATWTIENTSQSTIVDVAAFAGDSPELDIKRNYIKSGEHLEIDLKKFRDRAPLILEFSGPKGLRWRMVKDEAPTPLSWWKRSRRR